MLSCPGSDKAKTLKQLSNAEHATETNNNNTGSKKGSGEGFCCSDGLQSAGIILLVVECTGATTVVIYGINLLYNPVHEAFVDDPRQPGTPKARLTSQTTRLSQISCTRARSLISQKGSQSSCFPLGLRMWTRTGWCGRPHCAVCKQACESL